MTEVETGLSRGGSADTTEVETGLSRGGSADTTEVKTGLQEVGLLTRLKWRQDCVRWIC